MHIGDLVILRPHCRDSSRQALVVDELAHCPRHVEIKFLDNGERTLASKNNLDVISENR